MRTWLLPALLPLVFGLACSPADELRSLHAPLSAPTISLCLAASFLHLRARMLLLPAGVHPSLSPIRAGKQVLAGAGVRAKASVPTAAQWLLWVGWGAQTAGSLVICRWRCQGPLGLTPGRQCVLCSPGCHGGQALVFICQRGLPVFPRDRRRRNLNQRDQPEGISFPGAKAAAGAGPEAGSPPRGLLHGWEEKMLRHSFAFGKQGPNHENLI